MEPTQRMQTRPDGTTFTPKLVDGMEYLQQWRRENLYEYDQVIEYQRSSDQLEQAEATTEQAPSEINADQSQPEVLRSTSHEAGAPLRSEQKHTP